MFSQRTEEVSAAQYFQVREVAPGRTVSFQSDTHRGGVVGREESEVVFNVRSSESRNIPSSGEHIS